MSYVSKSKNLVKAKSKYGRNAECKAAVKTSMKIQKMVLALASLCQ
jgi:hypothetical protein